MLCSNILITIVEHDALKLCHVTLGWQCLSGMQFMITTQGNTPFIAHYIELTTCTNRYNNYTALAPKITGSSSLVEEKKLSVIVNSVKCQYVICYYR